MAMYLEELKTADLKGPEKSTKMEGVRKAKEREMEAAR